MATVINFSLDSQADRDIIKWLDEQPNRSAAIRAAIRAAMAKEHGATLEDVLAEIRALPSRLQVAPRDEATTDAPGEEPPGAAANLDGLLDRLSGDDWQIE